MILFKKTCNKCGKQFDVVKRPDYEAHQAIGIKPVSCFECCSQSKAKHGGMGGCAMDTDGYCSTCGVSHSDKNGGTQALVTIKMRWRDG